MRTNEFLNHETPPAWSVLQLGVYLWHLSISCLRTKCPKPALLHSSTDTQTGGETVHRPLLALLSDL